MTTSRQLFTLTLSSLIAIRFSPPSLVKVKLSRTSQMVGRRKMNENYYIIIISHQVPSIVLAPSSHHICWLRALSLTFDDVHPDLVLSRVARLAPAMLWHSEYFFTLEIFSVLSPVDAAVAGRRVPEYQVAPARHLRHRTCYLWTEAFSQLTSSYFGAWIMHFSLSVLYSCSNNHNLM